MKNIKLIYILTLFLSVITLSCKDNYEEDEAFVQGSDFRIVNAASSLATTPFQIYQDDRLILGNLLYATDTKYFRTVSTNSNLNIKTADASNTENLLLSINNSTANNQSVSYFVFNSSSTSPNLEFVKTIDDVSQPANDKVKVRVAHLVSNLPSNVDVIIRAKNQVLASNVAFKQVTDFFTIDRTDRIEIVYTGTTTAVRAFTPAQVSKGIYTFVLGGILNGNPALTVTQYSNTL